MRPQVPIRPHKTFRFHGTFGSVILDFQALCAYTHTTPAERV